MYRFCLWVIVLLAQVSFISINKCFANNQQADSLLLLIPQLKDSDRLETITKLIYAVNNNNAQALKYCKWLKNEAKEQNNVRFQSLALAKTVELYGSHFNSDSLFIVAKQYNEFCETNNYYESYFTVQAILVKRHVDKEHFTMAFDLAQKTYEKALFLNNKEGIAQSLSSLASAHAEIGNDNEAIKFVKEVIKILKDDPHPSVLMLLENYLNLACYSVNIKDYHASLTHIDSCIVYIDNKQKSRPFDDYSVYYFYAESIKLMVYSNLGETKKATEHLQKAKKLYKEIWSLSEKSMLDQALRDYYMHLGNYDKALQYNNENMLFNTNNGFASSLSIGWLEKAQIYYQMRDFEKSAEAYKVAINLSDSLNNKRFASQINELKTIYELDKAELETTKANLKLQATRQLLWVSIVISLLLVAIVLIIWYNQKQIKNKNKSLFKQINKQTGILEQYYEKEQEIRNSKITGKSENNKLESDNNKDDELYQRLKELMQKQKVFTDATLTRKALADKLNTNEAYLFDTIKKHHNLTFKEYLTSLRIEYSCNLLSDTNTDLTIEAIACDSGFGSRNTFYRLFRECYGLTPIEFRQMSSINTTSC